MLDKLFPEDEILIVSQNGNIIHRFPEGTSDWKPGILGRLLVISERYPQYHPTKLYWTTTEQRSEGLPPKPLLDR